MIRHVNFLYVPREISNHSVWNCSNYGEIFLDPFQHLNSIIILFNIHSKHFYNKSFILIRMNRSRYMKLTIFDKDVDSFQLLQWKILPMHRISDVDFIGQLVANLQDSFQLQISKFQYQFNIKYQVQYQFKTLYKVSFRWNQIHFMIFKYSISNLGWDSPTDTVHGKVLASDNL